MEAHHLRTIERLTRQFKDDSRYPALLIGGSLAKGRNLEYSDVDLLLVASDEEYARCVEKQHFWYFNEDICDYPGGYAEGKIIDLQFLKDVAHHGSEPARAAFVGAFLAYSRLPELDELLPQIPVYPEAEREEKMKHFYSQVRSHNWYAHDAERRQLRYLLAHAIHEMVFYASRLLLAYNHILYPYHKWLMYEVECAPEKPENFFLVEKLMSEQKATNAQALHDCIYDFRDWGVGPDESVVRFMKEREWNWRSGRAPLPDW